MQKSEKNLTRKNHRVNYILIGKVKKQGDLTKTAKYLVMKARDKE